MDAQKGVPKVYVAMLPALTAEELEELRIAIEDRMHSLAKTRAAAVDMGSESLLAEIDHRGLVCAALLTAVREAQLSVRPREGEGEG